MLKGNILEAPAVQEEERFDFGIVKIPSLPNDMRFNQFMKFDRRGHTT